MGYMTYLRNFAMQLIALLWAAIFGAGFAQAAMQRSLMRSPEALAMGGAYTAIVTGRDAPFYNPAGVAAIDSLSLHYLTLEGTISNWMIAGWKTASNLRNPSGSDLNDLMGENIYVQGAASAALLAPGFALIPFYDMQAALYAKNQAMPKIEYGVQVTSGLQAAFGFSIYDGKRRGRGRKNSENLNEWRFGIGAKYLSRTGGYRLLSAAELFSLDSSTANGLLSAMGTGYGLDLGVQRIQRLSSDVSLSWGAAFLNVGDVHFANGVSPVKGDLSTGLGLTVKKGLANFTLAYDLQQLNREDDFVKKQNFGMRIGLPLLDLYAGLHQGFLTYGAAFDIWLMRISGVVYKEELGAFSRQDTESRMALRIDLKMDF